MNHKKWEYKMFYTDRDQHKQRELEREFNKLGSHGWELVGYVMNDGTNARSVCFKRELG